MWDHRSVSRGFLLALLASLALGCLVTGCSRTDDRRAGGQGSGATSGASESRPRIVYAMPMTVAAIPAYVAYDRGFWRDEGLEVERKMFSAGRLALDALLAKSAQVMSVSETPLVHALRTGKEIVIVATVTEHRETKFLGRRGEGGISSPTDLRGRRIATLPGTNSDYFMHEYLRAHGMKRDDLVVVDLKPPDMVTALVRGDIAGYFAWEPHIFYGARRLQEDAVVFDAGALYRGRHCVAMNRDFVAANPDVVDRLLRGFLRAEKFVAQHPGEARRIVARTMELGDEIEVIERLWSEYVVKVQLDRTLAEILETETRWAASLAGSGDMDIQGARLDLSGAVYTDGLKRVHAQRVEIAGSPEQPGE